MTALLAGLSALLSPFKKVLAVFGLVVSVLGVAFLKGRSVGRRAEREKQEAALQQTEKRWDAIDRAPLDFDGAVERLRDRTRR